MTIMKLDLVIIIWSMLKSEENQKNCPNQENHKSKKSAKSKKLSKIRNSPNFDTKKNEPSFLNFSTRIIFNCL